MRLRELDGTGVRVFGDPGWRGPCPPEAAEQIAFFNQVRLRWPETLGRLAIHPRNEAMLRNGQHSALMRHKAEGMTPGAADIIIPGAPAFVCELKRQDRTKSAWQPGQVEYLKAAAQAGAFTCVALGAEAAIDAVKEWINETA